MKTLFKSLKRMSISLSIAYGIFASLIIIGESSSQFNLILSMIIAGAYQISDMFLEKYSN